MKVLWKRVWLWARLVGRTNQAEYRNGPVLGWELACIIHDSADKAGAK